MGKGNDVLTLVRSRIDLGRDERQLHLTEALRYRSVVISRLRWRQPMEWGWRGGRSRPGEEFAAIVFPEDAEAHLDGVESRRSGTAPFLLHDGMAERVRWEDAGACTMLWFPRRALTDLAGQDIEFPRTLAENLLTSGLRALLGTLSTAAPPVSSAVSAYVIERLLIEHVWGLVLESSGLPQVAGRRGNLYQRAHSLIRMNASDPQYGVASLVHDLAISERHLQRLFADRGITPRAMLRRTRVELASTMLRDAGYDILSLGQIAQSAGFPDAASMRSAFLHEGLPTPRRLRRDRDEASGAATLRAQADDRIAVADERE